MIYLAMKLAKFAKVVIIMVFFWMTMAGKVWAASDPFKGCNGPTSTSPAINTALGCIPVRIEYFVPWLLQYLSGIAGGISFLLMVYGFILMSTSAGDPKAVQGAQETITSAIMGLLVSIFALFLLRLIAVGILQIPGIN